MKTKSQPHTKLTTVSLSDIGKSLCDIDSDIRNNVVLIEKYSKKISFLRQKNAALRGIVTELLSMPTF